MSTAKSKIEWTNATWNPVRGCKLVSPGCTNCYAMKQAHRFSGAGKPYEGLTRLRKKGGPVWTGDFREVPAALGEPLSWRAPRLVFVNSMSDLFGEGVSNEFIAAVFGVMAKARRHTFQVLTKRGERLPAWFAWLDSLAPGALAERVAIVAEAERASGEPVGSRGTRRTKGQALVVHRAMERHRDSSRALDRASDSYYPDWPAPNVQIGVSVEDRKHGLPRIDHLRGVPAAARFLSIEPLLEDLGTIDLSGIHWVIVGGESGNGARPMHPDWARSIRDQCVAAGVPFFFKQWGGVRKKETGRDLDGRTWDEMPARAEVAHA